MRFKELRKNLDEKKISPREYLQECFRKIDSKQPVLNAFVSLNKEKAMQSAESAENRILKGERVPLLGVPLSIKDLIVVKDEVTTAASKMLKDYRSPFSATVVECVERSGAINVGKTNLDEFAFGSSNETSFFGPVKNPLDVNLSPGGSSGGSAASVAANMVPLSLGTDTGGSIRQPASFCGIVGMKPSYGRVSRFGVIAYASSLDQVGPFSHDVHGCAALLDSISAFDENDPSSSNQILGSSYDELNAAPLPSFHSHVFGVDKSLLELPGVSAEVVKTFNENCEFIKSQGAKIVDVNLHHSKFALATYYIIACSEASSNLARYDGIHFGHRSKKSTIKNLDEFYSANRGEGFGEEVKLRILLGTFSLSSGYSDAFFEKAARVRRLIANDFNQAFTQCESILLPTAPSGAFPLHRKISNPLEDYAADIFTIPVNLAGLPAISLPMGLTSAGLPLGIQFIGPRFGDNKIIRFAECFERLREKSS